MKYLLIAFAALAIFSAPALAAPGHPADRCEPPKYSIGQNVTQATWDYAVCRWVRDQQDNNDRSEPASAPAPAPAPVEQEEEHYYDD